MFKKVLFRCHQLSEFKSFSNKYSTSKLTHIDHQTNKPKQVDISDKCLSIRTAQASGYIQLNETSFNALDRNELKKGSALIVAQLAGIQATKQTSNLIPLCHQLQLDQSDIDFTMDKDKWRIYCRSKCKTSKSNTGVEMEALTGCSIALLTIYDMCKAVQKDAQIENIKLDYKTGGKSPDYTASSSK
jgi:cyclic pyranopterin monophosphate synthase